MTPENSQYIEANCLMERAETLAQPSFILRPKLFRDGDHWCALYGENIQEGVVGFGKSPLKAYADFDRAWREELS